MDLVDDDFNPFVEPVLTPWVSSPDGRDGPLVKPLKVGRENAGVLISCEPTNSPIILSIEQADASAIAVSFPHDGPKHEIRSMRLLPFQDYLV